MNRMFLTLVALWAPTVSPVAAPLTVVGFNVEAGDASDHVIALQLEKSLGVDLWGLADVWDEGGWPDRLRAGAAIGEGSEFGAVLGKTGGDSRLLVLYRQNRLQRLAEAEIMEARLSSREAAPLAVHFRLDDEVEFWFLVVNLADARDRRIRQAEALARWSAHQTLPVVAAGTFNFGVDAESGHPDAAMERLLMAGWQWIRPIEPVGTVCGSGDRVEDFIFLTDPGRDWGTRAQVMYSQSNYCPDSGRTSNHRPVQANLETAGKEPVITGSMPERQIRPFFPEELEPGERTEPALTIVPEQTPSHAGAHPEGAGSDALADPENRSRAALLRRLQALEAEARELRREIEALPD